ncbi:hypothetical protein BGZ46_009111 [Entomortierella lignicola]|nr:hypothetical protein BGZ46_009111 [Entomortierella lignicola]
MPLFIFDVTHILKHVGLYLSRRDIMYCSLVSFEWSQVFRHLFWSNFEVGNIDYAQLLTQPGHQEILEKNAPTIQTLIVRYSPKIMPLLEYLQEAPEILNSKRLTRLVLKHDGKLQDQNEVMDVEVLIKLLSITGKNLEELDANMDLLTRLAPSEFRKLRDSFQGLGCLRNLEFKGENRYVVPLLGFVLRYCPESVESLVFDFPVSQQSHPIGHWGFVEPNPEVNPTTEDLIASFWEKATQTNIQRIQLPRFLNSHEKTTLIPFLKYRCQNLKEWKSVSMTRPNEIIVELNETINRFCPQLSNLEFKDILLENRFIYPQIIRGCQGLQSLTVTGKVRDARGVLKAIVESQRETIKMIRWRASGGFPGGDGIEGELDIENVLKKCRKLERLETTFEDTKCFYSGQVVGAIWIRDEEVEDDKEGKGDKESEGGKDDGDKGGEKDKEGGGDKEEKKKEGEKEMPKEQSDGQQLTNSRLYWGCRSTIVYLDITFYPAKHIIDKKRFKKRVEDT